LESLLQSIRWNISGLIIGKFEQDANIDKFKLQDIITNKPQLKNIPVIANVNIGHVYPFATVPI
jgi:muramoyltetrapeptide carboxypeptidase